MISGLCGFSKLILNPFEIPAASERYVKTDKCTLIEILISAICGLLMFQRLKYAYTQIHIFISLEKSFWIGNHLNKNFCGITENHFAFLHSVYSEFGVLSEFPSTNASLSFSVAAKKVRLVLPAVKAAKRNLDVLPVENKIIKFPLVSIAFFGNSFIFRLNWKLWHEFYFISLLMLATIFYNSISSCKIE